MAVTKFDVIIIGAGAAGLMCAIEAGKRGRSVLILEKANKPGKKILMSGGGRCNFTNLDITPNHYLSNNPHFCKSALSRYTQWDFISLVKKHHIPYHEKKLGQLFCDEKSQAILTMLIQEAEANHVQIALNAQIQHLKQTTRQFEIVTEYTKYACDSLVIASGGLSIPTMGASAFGYKIAEQFGLKVWPLRAGLVPLTLHVDDKEKLAQLSGIAIDAEVHCDKMAFRENILFTHRGLSGPAILQISSYWQPGKMVEIDLLPNQDTLLKDAKASQSQKQVRTYLSEMLPKRAVDILFPKLLIDKKIQSLTPHELETLSELIHHWKIQPNGTEGYRTAEVTLGGVDCNALSSKTMQAKDVPGLFFIGEVVDVTGWLGGYNFQWAWSSAWAAGQVV